MLYNHLISLTQQLVTQKLSNQKKCEKYLSAEFDSPGTKQNISFSSPKNVACITVNIFCLLFVRLNAAAPGAYPIFVRGDPHTHKIHLPEEEKIC